ncbi:MAG: Gfo/Idh/MocA family oxidoreductase [Coriobacteriia bacterium]|jgi:predicted dehydrogenase|nr:Gfo/Idh/MocA family oxidoreductase [Coriobacteriia bacterium]
MSTHDILLVGMSSIVRRRVLPALLTLDRVGKVHVASTHLSDLACVPAERRGVLWSGYSEALAECEKPCIAYISLPNALHEVFAREALERGFHVIVDKPAVVGGGAVARGLTDCARSRDLVLAEATVWSWHPIAREAQRLASAAGSGPLHVALTFTSPPLELDDFRYSRSLGGGALLDRGPYIASCGRLLFVSSPTRVECVTFFDPVRGDVDIAAAMTLTYPTGVLQGYVSLQAEYSNSLEVVGADLLFRVSRIFSPPSDFVGEVVVTEANKTRHVQLPTGDCFAAFIDSVLDAVEHGDVVTHSEMLCADAEVLERLGRAAGGNSS